MKYHLDTIPVWDAVKKDGECPLCALERRTELGEAERYLGASVMEPDIRVTVNRSGFCTDHHRMLFSMSNRLGHALMLESHTIETRERMSRVFAELITTGKALSEAGLGDRISGKTKTASETVSRQAKAVCDVVSSCVMCDSIRENMQRYLHTFFHLYKKIVINFLMTIFHLYNRFRNYGLVFLKFATSSSSSSMMLLTSLNFLSKSSSASTRLEIGHSFST